MTLRELFIAFGDIIAYVFTGDRGTSHNPIEIPSEIPPEVVMESITLDWTQPKNAYHNTRVLCDKAGLTLDEKNILCACIFQESRFKNTAKNENKDSTGKVWSTDWGLVQVNDWYHVGVHKDFPSITYIVENPDKMVQWMIAMYKAGKLGMWASYSSHAYRQWLLPSSPMWLLK
jgi:hypothetical protein